MKKISNLDKIKAASILENQISLSLNIKLSDSEKHPIRLIQASKSLIGLNLNQPNQKLINFNSSYLESFDGAKYNIDSKFSNKLSSVVSMHDLENAFLNQDKKLILRTFHELKLVSSEMHILEYLIEISLKQTGKSFILIWSLYRSILFLSDRNTSMFINLATDIILSDRFEKDSSYEHSINISDIINYDLSFHSISLYAHLLEAYSSDLIRSSNVKFLINSFINKKFNSCKLNKFDVNKSISYNHILKEGRVGLLRFIDDKNMVSINVNFILLLNSIRALLRFCDNKDYKMICFHFENILEDLNV